MPKPKFGVTQTLLFLTFCAVLTFATPGLTQPAPQPPLHSLSPEEYFQQLEQRMRTEFSDWRYPNSSIEPGFKQGAAFQLDARTKDDPAKVWSFYLDKLSIGLKVPLADVMSWKGGDKIQLGNNPDLNLTYVLRLNANPALQSGHMGMILCQKGQESVCITVSSVQPYPTANPETHIELFKVKAPELAQKNDALDYPPNFGSFLTVPSTW